MKRFIALFLASVSAFSFMACTKAPDEITTDPVGTDKSVGIDFSQKEAPELAKLVSKGELPPLEERIPVASDIMIEPDVIELGKYGGTFTATSNDSGRWDWGPYTEQSMFRFKQDGSSELEANVCKDFYSNENATVWTIELREGMKWSDGHPLTADDVVFYYDHMATPSRNDDGSTADRESAEYYNSFTSKAYNCYQVEIDDVRYWAELEKVDDYKVTFTFKAPKPTFAQDAAIDNKWMYMPKHFYKEFVARKDGVTDDETFPLITEDQALANANKAFEKQWDSYGTMSRNIGYYHWDYAIIPQLRSFIAVEDNHNAVGETFKLVRNPYFFKTDSEGRQLPYLDAIEFKIINEQDQVTLSAMSGELDYYVTLDDYSTVVQALEDTHSVVELGSSEWSNIESIQFNQSILDDDKRAVFQNIKFREAMSICVDRDLLNETLRNGMSEPWQASVPEGLPGHDPEWSKKWTEYDVDRANELLDDVTEPWDKKAGTYRKMLGTDRDLEIVVSIEEISLGGEFLELFKSATAKVGVNILTKVDAEMDAAVLTNTVEAQVVAMGLVSPAIRPENLVPTRSIAGWCTAYGKWYEDGKTEDNGGIAPTGDMLALSEAYDKLKAATGDNRDEVVAVGVQEIYDLHKENVWILGFLKPQANRCVVNKDLKNFPEETILTDEFRWDSVLRAEQLWFDN